MKIFGLNQTNNINKNKKIAEKSNMQSPITQNQKEIAKNSLSEAIGRSQVSFKGESHLSGSILKYENVAKLTGKSENFVYNKEDGSIKYEEYTSNGTLKKRYVFNPAKGIEETTLLRPNGIITIDKKDPELCTSEGYDKEGRIIYHEESEDDSYESKMNRVSVSYEYGDKEREIIRRYKNGEVAEIEVIDPRTGEVVTEGRLLERTYTKNDGWTITDNIVTGDVYEKEKVICGRTVFYEEYSRNTLALIHEFKEDQKTGNTVEIKYTDDGKHILFNENRTYDGFVLYSAKYDPESLKLVKESSFDQKRSERTEKEFFENGIIKNKTITKKDGTIYNYEYDKNGNIEEKTIVSKNGREVDEYKYDKNGEIISDIHYSYKRNGKDLASKTEYIPNTEIIERKTEYKTDSSYTIYSYNTKSLKTNVPEESETYENNVLVSEETYFSDGNRIEYQAVYDEDRYITLTRYAKNGRTLEKSYLTAEKEKYQYEKFDDYGDIEKRVKILKGMNVIETTNFKDGVRTKFTRTSQTTKKPIIQIEFYKDGKTEKIRRDFNADGSYTKTEFDEYGNVTSRTEYEPKNKGTENTKNTENNKNTRSTQNTQKSTSKTQQSKEELLKSLASKVARKQNFKPSQATKEEIAAILEVTGFESAEELFTLNKKQYRTLATKFHPDKWQQQPKELQDMASLIFQIISNIYSNSPNEGV